MIFGGPGFISGFAMGFGTGFVSREIVKISASVAKPVARTILKAGVTAFEKSRESMAQIGESFEDIVAEVRANMAFRTVPVSSPVTATTSTATGSTVTSAEIISDDKETRATMTTEEHPKKKGSHK